jgi:hypothetical protein
MIVNTIRGEMDDSLLNKKEGSIDNDNENTTWVEYYLDGVLVHRSAHVSLKRPLVSISEVGGFNG